VADGTYGTGPEGSSNYNNPCCDWWKDPTTANPARYSGRFGSVHPTGMMSVFCDGSVKVVPFSTPDTMFFRMCNRRDGLTVDFGQ
jgi:hypothetical protein